MVTRRDFGLLLSLKLKPLFFRVDLGPTWINSLTSFRIHPHTHTDKYLKTDTKNKYTLTNAWKQTQKTNTHWQMPVFHQTDKTNSEMQTVSVLKFAAAMFREKQRPLPRDEALSVNSRRAGITGCCFYRPSGGKEKGEIRGFPDLNNIYSKMIDSSRNEYGRTFPNRINQVQKTHPAVWWYSWLEKMASGSQAVSRCTGAVAERL